MIAFIQGTVDTVDTNAAVIDVGGIGFEVQVSGETAARLSSAGSSEQVKLYTFLNVDREGAMSLIGFLSRDELFLFRQLITVNGVGPRAGLSLISAIGADELRFAIASGDAKAISKAPGIGKKTADRLVLELRDKLSSYPSAGQEDAADLAGAASAALTGDAAGSAGSDAVLALTALGYTRAEAVHAVQNAWKDLSTSTPADSPQPQASDTNTISTEDLLKAALRYLG